MHVLARKSGRYGIYMLGPTQVQVTERPSAKSDAATPVDSLLSYYGVRCRLTRLLSASSQVQLFTESSA